MPETEHEWVRFIERHRLNAKKIYKFTGYDTYNYFNVSNKTGIETSILHLLIGESIEFNVVRKLIDRYELSGDVKDSLGISAFHFAFIVNQKLADVLNNSRKENIDSEHDAYITSYNILMYLDDTQSPTIEKGIFQNFNFYLKCIAFSLLNTLDGILDKNPDIIGQKKFNRTLHKYELWIDALILNEFTIEVLEKLVKHNLDINQRKEFIDGGDNFIQYFIKKVPEKYIYDSKYNKAFKEVLRFSINNGLNINNKNLENRNTYFTFLIEFPHVSNKLSSISTSSTSGGAKISHPSLDLHEMFINNLEDISSIDTAYRTNEIYILTKDSFLFNQFLGTYQKPRHKFYIELYTRHDINLSIMEYIKTHPKMKQLINICAMKYAPLINVKDKQITKILKKFIKRTKTTKNDNKSLIRFITKNKIDKELYNSSYKIADLKTMHIDELVYIIYRSQYLTTKKEKKKKEASEIPIKLPSPIIPKTCTSLPLQGRPSDVLLGSFYLISKYKNICLPISKENILNLSKVSIKKATKIADKFNTEIMYEHLNGKVNVGFPNGFGKIMRNCIKNKKVEYIVIPLVIITHKITHANVLLYNKQSKIIERFEPHGTDIPYNSELLDKTLTKRLKKFIPFEKYLKPEEFMPAFSFQSIQEYYFKNRFTGIPGGYCLTWAFWYIELRLQNPEATDLSKLVSDAVRKIFLVHTNFTEFIDNYSIWLRKYSESILKKADITLKAFEKGDITYKQYINLINNVLLNEFKKYLK